MTFGTGRETYGAVDEGITPMRPVERRVQSAQYLRNYISSRSSFEVSTALPTAERLVQSLHIDRDIGM